MNLKIIATNVPILILMKIVVISTANDTTTLSTFPQLSSTEKTGINTLSIIIQPDSIRNSKIDNYRSSEKYKSIGKNENKIFKKINMTTITTQSVSNSTSMANNTKGENFYGNITTTSAKINNNNKTSSIDFLQVYDFNPNDFEDLHEKIKMGNLNNDQKEYIKFLDNDQPYNENFKENQPTTTTEKYDNDGIAVIQNLSLPSINNKYQHVYKIIKKIGTTMKSIIIPSPYLMDDFQQQQNDSTKNKEFHGNENNSKSLNKLNQLVNENQFHLITQLFDHIFWKSDAMTNNGLSQSCSKQMKSYLMDLKLMSQWALKVYDSSGRYTGQLLYGSYYWLGAKEFCQDVNNEFLRDANSSNSNVFKVKFSIIKIILNIDKLLPKGKLITIGQCLPSSCTIKDVEIILKLDVTYQKLSFLQHVQNHTTSNFNVKDFGLISVRHVPGDYNIFVDKKFFLLCTICIFIAVIMFIATIYECYQLEYNEEHKSLHILTENVNNNKDLTIDQMKIIEMNQLKSTLNNNNTAIEPQIDVENTEKLKQKTKGPGYLIACLLCFSILSNAKAIFSVKPLSSNSITSIHGLRTFSLLWIILVHTYLQLQNIGSNKYILKLVQRTFSYQFIGNATFSVDTFFFISGLLVTVLFFRGKKEDKNISPFNFSLNGLKKWCIMIIYRFIRLTPAYMFTIVFSELALKTSFNNSVFSSGVFDDVTCEKYWWRNILYINNWYPFNEFCMVWSWYLANDMQFYLIATLLLIFIIRYFKASVTIFIFLLFSSWIISAYMSIHHNYIHKVIGPFESFDFLYDKPWQRFGPYAMGMITGYIHHHVKNPLKPPLILNLLLWSISLGILFIVVFGVWDGALNLYTTSLYVSLAHTAWGFSLIWITLSCSWGFAKPFNNFLSYEYFYPLSRLAYCAYLVHPIFQIIVSMSLEGAVYLQHTLVVLVFLGNAVFAFIGAFFVSLMFEAPIVRLLKIVFN